MPETARQIIARFYMEPSWVCWNTLCCRNHYSNDDPRTTFAYLKSRSKFGTSAFTFKNKMEAVSARHESYDMHTTKIVYVGRQNVQVTYGPLVPLNTMKNLTSAL